MIERRLKSDRRVNNIERRQSERRSRGNFKRGKLLLKMEYNSYKISQFFAMRNSLNSKKLADAKRDAAYSKINNSEGKIRKLRNLALNAGISPIMPVADIRIFWQYYVNKLIRMNPYRVSKPIISKKAKNTFN